MKELQAKNDFMHVQQVRSWQEQRAARVSQILREYNDKGWVLVESTEILNQPLHLVEQGSGLEPF